MKIIHKKDVPHVDKPEGTKVSYYLHDEYEIHYDEQAPHTKQTWHQHEKIFETLFIIEGELIVEWKEGNETKKEIVKTGDLIETENTVHTFSNDTDKVTKYIVIKQVLSGENKRDILETDKIVYKG